MSEQSVDGCVPYADYQKVNGDKGFPKERTFQEASLPLRDGAYLCALFARFILLRIRVVMPNIGGDASCLLENDMVARTLYSDEIKDALIDPSSLFDEPADVVKALGISNDDKIRILHRWEYDVREEEVAQEENMQGELRITLSQVLEALDALGSGPDHRHPAKQ